MKLRKTLRELSGISTQWLSTVSAMKHSKHMAASSFFFFPPQRRKAPFMLMLSAGAANTRADCLFIILKSLKSGLSLKDNGGDVISWRYRQRFPLIDQRERAIDLMWHLHFSQEK